MKLFRFKSWLNKRNGWIDVKDALPPESEHVLTYCEAWYSYKVDYITKCGDKIIWMKTVSEYQDKIGYWKYIKSPYETI